MTDEPRKPRGRTAQPELAAEIGRRLRTARDKAGIYRDTLSAAAGFSPSYVTQIERGAVLAPVSSLVKLAKALGLSSYKDLLPPQATAEDLVS